jgi:hypothetical protein
MDRNAESERDASHCEGRNEHLDQPELGVCETGKQADRQTGRRTESAKRVMAMAKRSTWTSRSSACATAADTSSTAERCWRALGGGVMSAASVAADSASLCVYSVRV